MKKNLIATALIASAGFTAAANADHYVSVGMHDFGDAAFYVKAGGKITDVIQGHVFYSDTHGGLFRATGEYTFMTTDSGDDIYAIAGVSHFDYGSITFMGQKIDLGDDTGAIAGVGYSMSYGNRTLSARATYDTMFDGFFGVGVTLVRPITDSLGLEIDYKLNSNSMSNEWGVGLKYSF